MAMSTIGNKRRFLMLHNVKYLFKASKVIWFTQFPNIHLIFHYLFQ